jgi:hypothetical protein
MDTALVTGVNGLVAAALAIVWKFFPGVKRLYGNLNGDMKGLVNLGLITLFVAGQYALSAAGVLDVFESTSEGIWDAVVVWIAALAANQGTYLSTKDVGKKKGP